MSTELKLTKQQLRLEQKRLARLRQYLPTLQLKKAMLQSEVQEVSEEIARIDAIFQEATDRAMRMGTLLKECPGLDVESLLSVSDLKKRYENIAGVEVPYIEEVTFSHTSFSLFETPPWIESFLEIFQQAIKLRIEREVAQEKKQALEKELREVSIRVNLFEKVLIPRTLKHIRKIKVFLDDQMLSAISQAKAAKRKIREREEQGDLSRAC